MALHVIKKGLDLPIEGAPEPLIEAGRTPQRVALTAVDYIGMKPTFLVKVGDTVQRGQKLFEDKKTPGVCYTAPGAGVIAAINRGDRRAFQSVVIDLDEAERAGGDAAQVAFAGYLGKEAELYTAAEAKALLLESGLWTALRTRPFSKVADPSAAPKAIFITAIDTNPLAPNPEAILTGREADVNAALRLLKKLTPGRLYFCQKRDAKFLPSTQAGANVEYFEGPHPAGNVGTHIHLLEGVSAHKSVWHIGYQDLLAIGVLVRTGKLDLSRVIALAGPGVKRPRLLRTRLGAEVASLIQDELNDGEMRVISGSVLSGRACAGEVEGYLGRYHNQISVLREGRERVFLGWLGAGFDMFSVSRAFLSSLIPNRKYAFTTTTNGSHRAMVPIGLYEQVMPLDILPTFLLRSLSVHDVERAEQLGCLELDEEDLSLCTFVCPGKQDYGRILRENLTLIEKEG
jgi:Na+-transporting NADH:ubiquinone oxidoreductase subunit A